jgi:hypothetical protein
MLISKQCFMYLVIIYLNINIYNNEPYSSEKSKM